VKTIVAINAKGGVGKSTFAVYLAEALAIIGRNVLVCDLDPAQAASEVLKSEAHAQERVRAVVRSLTAPTTFSPDFRVIDTVGNSELANVLKPLQPISPDLFVVPTNASTFDLRQMIYTLEAIRPFRGAHKRILWSRIQQNTRITRPEVLSSYATLAKTDAFKTIVPHSVHYAQMDYPLNRLPEARRDVWVNLAREIESLCQKSPSED
jgi:cellulose biosynthesis protein BcsQ